jgi:putative redox protein
MSGDLSVRYLDGDRFAIDVRSHVLLVDQPVDAGGTDEAPTPTELFIGGLASCVAFYARRYLARHEIPTKGLAVHARYDMGGRPNRVTSISIDITPPPGLPRERRDAFLAVGSHCTVHNTLSDPPEIDITLKETASTSTGLHSVPSGG